MIENANELAQLILGLRLKKIQESAYSKYIPYSKQIQERDRQVVRAYRKFASDVKALEVDSAAAPAEASLSPAKEQTGE